MKFHRIVSTSIFVATLVMAPFAIADILIKIPNGNDALCTELAGHWAGKGTVSFCNYSGQGTITGASPFNAVMDLNATSPLCPSEKNFSLTGSCQNGKIIVKSNQVNLNGAVTEGHMELKGKINIPVLGWSNADIQLAKG